MVKLVNITKSPLASKKLRAYFDDGTHTDFGDSSMEDYTIHNIMMLKEGDCIGIGTKKT